ncbi:HAD hydrolase family protein [Oenococcus sicerae]|uniref:HAD family phosphatase n=1 Tax=Oenococcus sicerae TaxID=2203724 RepID=A0AAJ1RA75_9LACO|nr:HAD hydrolase family protein [Oenococcus sicerae]MDN6900601.1 HAD family phosphatase [Oenococcus sicerae]QAS69382.1 HAD hydrolase family protein [Oenococcus sicerae]
MIDSDIKLFAADMDGTLLDGANSFNQKKFAQVINILRRQNKKFVLATGNQVSRIQRMFLPFDPKGQVISMVAENGAFIQEGARPLYQSVIDPIKVNRIFDLLPRLDPQPTLAVFAGKESAFAPKWQQSVRQPDTQIFFAGTIDDFFPSWSAIDDADEISIPIDKISLSWAKDSGQHFLNSLKHDPLLSGLRTPTSGFGAIDIVNEEADKASGLKMLAKEFAVDRRQMAAFGDGLNDLEMLQYVGRPYVMPNAQDELKAYFKPSQYADSDNNHDGVLNTILDLIEEHN